MIGKYKIITICGSTRFQEDHLRVQTELTLKGNVVIPCAFFSHGSDKNIFESMSDSERIETKKLLDDIHKRKIDLADEIYVVNKGGYIGESTKSEIEYALSLGKKVNYME
jgi:hypothetical protein